MGCATNYLSRRIWFTLGALVVYRLGTHIPIPGIDPSILATAIERYAGWTIEEFAFALPLPYSMSLFALGILPYISAVVILELLTAVSPQLAALKQAGEAGRRKIDRYACYGAVLLAIFQSYRIAVGLESFGGEFMVEPGPWFRVTTVLTMTTGVILLMWLAGQIDRRGIGPGAFLILASAIAADLPAVWATMLDLLRTGVLGLGFGLVLLPLVVLAVVAASVALAYAHRPICLHFEERGIDTAGSETNKAAPLIPLCFAGLGPVVLAAMLVVPPQRSVSGLWIDPWHVPLIQLGPPVSFVAALVLVFALTLVLGPTVAKSADLAAALRERGAAIPGVRPGGDTAAQLDGVVRRLAPVAGLLIALVIVVPDIFLLHYYSPWPSSGVGMLILTFVMLAVVRQIRDQSDPGARPSRHGSAIALWPAAWVWLDSEDESQHER